ncbi:MAG: AI-2E family transporter [Polyangiaceae bacterium]|nr:AI-2E family transporter [Polyangiaceae bacterium]
MVELIPTKWHRPLFLALSSVIVMTVIIASRAVILPIVIGVVLAYVLMPLVEWVETKRVSRVVAILLVYVGVLGSGALFLRMTAPRMGREIGTFAREVPELKKQVIRVWIPKAQSLLRSALGEPEESPPASTEPAAIVRPLPTGGFAVDFGSGVQIRPSHNGYIIDNAADVPKADAETWVSKSMESSVAYVQHNAFELVKLSGGIILSIGRAFFVFGLSLMLAAYLMMTKERIFAFLMSLVRPSVRFSFERLIARIDRGLSGVVRGQLIICLINGALSAVGFALFKLKYWPILAVVATVFSLVPIFGSIASSVPAVALGLTQSWQTAAFVLLWIVGIHQIEANFLNPKIMGDAAKIHPVWVVFSLLVGEHFFGTLGALLAVPVMSIAQSIFLHFRQIVQQTDPELAREPILSSMPPGYFPPNSETEFGP